MEADLLERLLQEKHAAREQVLLAERKTQTAASTVAHILQDVEHAEEQLAIHLSAEEAAKVESDAADKAAAEAETARSTAEAQLLVGHMEQDLCRLACAILLAEEKDLQMPADQVSRVQKICEKLDLEDSLRCTLPLVLQKPAGTRSFLEKAAAQLITKAMQEHMDKLSQELTSDEVQGSTEAATARAQETRASSKAAQASLAKARDGVRAAQAAVDAVRARLDQARAEERRALAESVDASSTGAKTMESLRQFRKGALAAYQSLEGPAVPCQAVDDLERKISDFEESCRIEVRELRKAMEEQSLVDQKATADEERGDCEEALPPGPPTTASAEVSEDGCPTSCQDEAAVPAGDKAGSEPGDVAMTGEVEISIPDTQTDEVDAADRGCGDCEEALPGGPTTVSTEVSEDGCPTSCQDEAAVPAGAKAGGEPCDVAMAGAEVETCIQNSQDTQADEAEAAADNGCGDCEEALPGVSAASAEVSEDGCPTSCQEEAAQAALPAGPKDDDESCDVAMTGAEVETSIPDTQADEVDAADRGCGDCEEALPGGPTTVSTEVSEDGCPTSCQDEAAVPAGAKAGGEPCDVAMAGAEVETCIQNSQDTQADEAEAAADNGCGDCEEALPGVSAASAEVSEDGCPTSCQEEAAQAALPAGPKDDDESCDVAMTGAEVETSIPDTQADEVDAADRGCGDCEEALPGGPTTVSTEVSEDGCPTSCQDEAAVPAGAKAGGEPCDVAMAGAEVETCIQNSQDTQADEVSSAQDSVNLRSVFNFGLATMLLTLSGCGEAPEPETQRE
ncbi:unnamed protein product [Symbiodinium natans]|uniref:Uncharacterized protein n=1 Tax=Symbiodinium natans TaxID=878477 RepID=A0A812I9H9_9DINO|nr:unnamed protein product [Symbiodinium natans]